jgi:hypothetical protein
MAEQTDDLRHEEWLCLCQILLPAYIDLRQLADQISDLAVAMSCAHLFLDHKHQRLTLEVIQLYSPQQQASKKSRPLPVP